MRTLGDNQGNTYNIPNFLIVDPVFFKEFDTIQLNNAPETQITVTFTLKQIGISNFVKNTKIKFKISNKANIEKVKRFYCEKEGITYNEHNVRFLYRGQEMKNEQLLCYHNIDESVMIQAIATKKKDKETQN